VVWAYNKALLSDSFRCDQKLAQSTALAFI
jgi:hypothetical protein